MRYFIALNKDYKRNIGLDKILHLLTIIKLSVSDNDTIFLKKMARAYFRCRIFSKSFGGKIKNFQTDVDKQYFFFKWRMRIVSARIFSKSFGGKIKNFQTDVNKKFFFLKKLAHAYFRRPYILLSLGRKIKKKLIPERAEHLRESNQRNYNW